MGDLYGPQIILRDSTHEIIKLCIKLSEKILKKILEGIGKNIKKSRNERWNKKKEVRLVEKIQYKGIVPRKIFNGFSN